MSVLETKNYFIYSLKTRLKYDKIWLIISYFFSTPYIYFIHIYLKKPVSVFVTRDRISKRREIELGICFLSTTQPWLVTSVAMDFGDFDLLVL